MDVGGTTEEIKQAIVECLREIYPRGRTEGGISVTCFKGRTGADGQHLIGFDGGAKLAKALDELEEEGVIVSNGGHGAPVFHYKTDAMPPVVGQMEEIKLAIVECLCRSPKELVRVGIELTCFKDRYGNLLTGANGLPLVGLGSSEKIRRALDDLVAEGRIDTREKEMDGEVVLHYGAKAGGSATPGSPAPRPAGVVTGHVTPPETGQRSVNIGIPARENMHNEFKETFSVPTHGGRASDVKMEVAIAVAAFTNAEGGRVFIGVRNDGTPAGLEKDLKQHKNTDGLELAIRNFLDSKLKSLVDVGFDFSGDDYLVITVAKGKKLVFTTDGNLYVRRGNLSKKLTPADMADYQSSH